METREMKLVYDTLMSAPGMGQQVKIDLRLERKQALFLVAAIKKGLADENTAGFDPLSMSPEGSSDALTEITAGILEKSGLAELYNKLQLLINKG